MDKQMNHEVLLTDMYQFTMCYGYFKAGIHNQTAVFDLFFRKSPFGGEYTIFGGLEDCINYVKDFKFTQTDMSYLKELLPSNIPQSFYEYLHNLDFSKVKITAISEGNVVFPRVPLITVEGPIGICQLLETPFLNFVNFSSLIATNAARFRHVAGPRINLLELGLRRAQGPNGGLTASKYSYIGGFDGTSNVLAGKLYGVPVKGTQAHAFVTAFDKDEPLNDPMILNQHTNKMENIFDLAEAKLHSFNAVKDLKRSEEDVNMSEFKAFCAWAVAFPNNFLVLIDTFKVLKSGVINFLAVAFALDDLGYQSIGVRIDSGDLSYLSLEVRAIFSNFSRHFPNHAQCIANFKIVVSNDINEGTIDSINRQGHSIDSYGVGTHLVTCQRQPALGCVYKLVCLADTPKIKISEDVAKLTIPFKKHCFRLYGKNGKAMLDYMTEDENEIPEPQKEMFCFHPFDATKRARVIPFTVKKLNVVYWDGGQVATPLPSIHQIKNNKDIAMAEIREDHLRSLNPTPFKVSLSENMYNMLHTLWLANTPISRLE
uniref:Nicotinate phosphoribosyltransferase n=1 Tax=Rhabditophanes sp. KR3021 TaxID=114890 RepID=A0AC35TU94_9BILA